MSALLSLGRRYPVLTLAMLAIVSYLVLTVTGHDVIARWIGIGTVLLVIVVTAVSMIRDILRGHYGLDILALVAMIATLSVGEILAALIIVLMLSGGEALEDYAAHRASRELTALLERSPSIAHRRVEHAQGGTSSYEDIGVDEVNVGDLLLVRPSEIIPVNGTLLAEEATFDESSLTGESLPVTRVRGETLLSGIVNGEHAIEMRATHLSDESEYQNILKLVREAQATQAPVVRLADRFAVPFTLVSLAIAGIAWAISGDPLRFAQVLVLATPCPLLIAAPVAFLGGLSRSARAGIVVKGGAVLEQLASLKSIAFDKTGTLTRGEPQLIEVRAVEPFTRDALLTLVASAEQYSSHVLGEGVIRAAREEGLTLLSGTDAREVATNGVSATVDGKHVTVGKFDFVRQLASEAQETPLRPGELAAYVSIDGAYAGAIVMADALRPEAPALVQWLEQQGIENMSILSGDAHETVHSVAREVGIETAHGDLMPTDKVELVRSFPSPSLMVGDGVNDAPVLAAANVGIAMGARGSTAAGEASDAVILKDSVTGVAHVIDISRHTLRIALQAIWIGIALSIGLMLIATTGVIPAVAGALIQEIIDLVAILYALRTLSGKLPHFNVAPAGEKRSHNTTTAHLTSRTTH